MLLVAELRPSNLGPSELRVSKYMADGQPHFVCKITGDFTAVDQAIQVLRAG